MAIEIISDITFTDPSNLIPYLEKDSSIVRGVTRGMLDFSNTETYAGSGTIPSGAVFTSLTSDLGTASVNMAFPALSGGMLELPTSGVPRATLPDTFKLLSTTKKFSAILWVHLPASGWQTASSNVNNALIGHLGNTGSLAQWGITVSTVQATGTPNQLSFFSPVSSSSGGAISLGNADTLALCNGNLHQVVVCWDGSVAGTVTRSIYVDKVLKVTSSQSWDNTFVMPTATQCNLGSNFAFQTVYPASVRFGRPSLWDLTNSSLSFTDVIARDWDSSQGYLT